MSAKLLRVLKLKLIFSTKLHTIKAYSNLELA